METKNKLKLYLKDLNLKKRSLLNYNGLSEIGYQVFPGFLSDEELREYTLDFTSRMRGSDEGQEGLSSFLEKRDANWKS